MQTSTPDTPVSSVRDSRSLLPGGFHERQSVSVISVYVSSRSWERHETHKASLCQPCGLQLSVPSRCHRNKNTAKNNRKTGFGKSCWFFLKSPERRHVQSSDGLRCEHVSLIKMCDIHTLFLVLFLQYLIGIVGHFGKYAICFPT